MANRSSSFIEIEAGSRMIVRNDITKVKADVIVNTEYESGAGIYHGTSSKFFKRSRDIRQSMLDAYPFLQNMYSADDGNRHQCVVIRYLLPSMQRQQQVAFQNLNLSI